MLVFLVLWVVALCNALSSGGPLLQCEVKDWYIYTVPLTNTYLASPCPTYCTVTAVVHTTIIFIDVTASAATVPM